MDVFRKMSKWISITLLSVMLSNVALADVTYFHNDISGSPMAATDSAGNLLWKESYKPYGDKFNRSASSHENKIGFHGKPYDDSTGLSYMGARYYDPVLGRFMGVDPVDYQTDNLHSFNRYTYANNNPYKYVDPDGRFAFLVVPAVYLLTALAAAATVSTVLNGGRNAGPGDVSIGPLSYPGSDMGNSSQWARGKTYSEADTNTAGTKDSDKGCIYCVPGEKTRSGNDYIGSTDNLDQRKRDKSDGRDRDGARIVGEYDKSNRDERRNKEQQAINDHGGVGNLDNRRNEVKESKWQGNGITAPHR